MRDIFGMGGLLLSILGPLATYAGVVPPMGGFVPFALGGITGLVVALVSAVQAMRGHGFGRGGIAGAIAGALVLSGASAGNGKPRINDFTTDLAEPPAFVVAAKAPQNVDRDMGYPIAWGEMQKACCADLRPAKLAVPPADAFARAKQVAEGMPNWTVVGANPQALWIEANETSRVFRFVDDVVIRVRPTPDGGSLVDVRSKSRDGKGDLGANAARIRAFVAALEAAR